ncbi:MAG: GDP-mannose 4,6-dehydratase [Chloroflexi bacterium RBG_13_46_14]|nr:MAG: GDP-mannose 4,6-dehydratase [Chloroflexi bacterium RBG_13_46_14]
MNKAVVTGGAGFIGSHLTEELVRRGYSVTVVDNLSSGKMNNIERLISSNKISFVQESITNLLALNKIFSDADYVFHLAALGSVPQSVEKPEIYHENNVTGTFKVLLAARGNKVKKVVYTSSSAVYGDDPELPKREDMLPSTISPYAVTKLAGEYYCQAFHAAYGLPTICLRFFNVFGPRQDPNSQYAAVIPSFIKRIQDGNPPIIYGDGEQTRDFTYVTDVVEAMILAAENDATGIFNISRGESITINELVDTIIRIIGTDVRPEYREPRQGDIVHSYADITKAKSFGFSPRYTLEEGISRMIKEFT